MLTTHVRWEVRVGREEKLPQLLTLLLQESRRSRSAVGVRAQCRSLACTSGRYLLYNWLAILSLRQL